MTSVLSHRPGTNPTFADSDGRTVDRRVSSSSVPAPCSPSAAFKSQSAETRTRTSNRTSISSAQTVSSRVSSARSPLTSDYKPTNGRHRPKKLKSQYPRDGGENHVEYILVASFHIDRGPIMEHQYPGAISGDEHMLAELMLPDQAHVRNQDWTIFFLHKDTSADNNADGSDLEVVDNIQRKRRKRSTDESTEDGDDSDEADSQDEDDTTDSENEYGLDEGQDEADDTGEGPPLVYVLNLVNTKQDTSAKRGAIVKAMAICTRHSFLHIYKPLLLLALEEYFKSPFPETLATLYEAVNSMDLSLMPRLSVLERYILQASDTKDLFIEKFAQMIHQRMAEEYEQSDTIDLPKNPDKLIEDASRMGSTKTASAGQRYSLPRDTHEFETRVVYNGIPIPVKVPTALSPETVGGFSLIKLIQTFSGPHAKDPQPFMLHSHLTTGGAYTHPIIVLANALLTEKRVIFLGHNRPSGEVAEAVLAACALTSGGVLRGFTRHAFPYTDLSKIDDLLKVPGFVAGVTNPAFANHPEWWDLLCDLPTGRMKISNRIEPAPIKEGLLNFQQQNPLYGNPSNFSNSGAGSDPTGDQTFMEDVLRSIASRHGEAVIRAKWRDWVVKFTRIAAAFEESVYGASALYVGGEEDGAVSPGVSGHGYVWSDEASRQRELAGSVSRIEGWRNTRSYYSFIQDLAQMYTVRPIKSVDLHHLHDLLRTRKLSAAESAAIYRTFSSRIHSYAEICQLLTVTPESHAGLFYLSLGLFHPQADVRAGTVELLTRIREHLAGRHFWNGLSRYAKLAFFRQKREAERRRLDGREDLGEGHEGLAEGASRVGSEEDRARVARGS